MINTLLNQLAQVEKLANYSKLQRLFHSPFKFLFGILYRGVVYKFTKKGLIKVATTFWGKEMKVILPSAFDIYLTGGKSHESEIRLSRFMIKNLREGGHFLDFGTHYGFFTLLASECVGPSGKVVGVEASSETYTILKENIASSSNITVLNCGVSDSSGYIEFSEFPVLYSEYNTAEPDQYKNEAWYRNNPPKRVKVKTITGDEVIGQYNIHPDIIKIDVEGSEFRVVKGLREFLSKNNPYLVMEFVSDIRGNENHIQAEELLVQLGYGPHKLLNDGSLEEIASAQKYIEKCGVESDNIIYRRQVKN